MPATTFLTSSESAIEEIAMTVPLVTTRRKVLAGLAAIAPLPMIGYAKPARAADDDAFFRISRTITGSDDLSLDVATRIRSLLSDRTDGFDAALDDLSQALDGSGGDRDAMLGALSDAQVETALAIARPWYLGYVGTPSSFVMDDDAAFATFLEAQSWQKIVDHVPRPTYPGHAEGWWDVPPPGVEAPPMPDEIASWTFHPGGPPEILAPDAEWKAYATADHPSIERARAARPGGGPSSD